MSYDEQFLRWQADPIAEHQKNTEAAIDELIDDDEKRRIYAENQATTILTPAEGPGRWVPEGESIVTMRRMEALKAAIDELPVNVFDEQLAAVQWHWDNVHRALTKAFGLPR